MGLHKKKHSSEHENHERWLVSYADFITLLFAFFVVLYATSEANQEKQKQFQESLKEHLRGLSFLGEAPSGLGSRSTGSGPRRASGPMNAGNRVIPPIGLPLSSRADRLEIWETAQQWLEQMRQENLAWAQAWTIQEGGGEKEIVVFWSLPLEYLNDLLSAQSVPASFPSQNQVFWQGLAWVIVLIKKLDCPLALSWRGGGVPEERVISFLLNIRKRLLSQVGLTQPIFIQINPALFAQHTSPRLVFSFCGNEGE